MPSTLISRIINNITKHHQPTIPYAQQLSTQPPLSDPTTTTTTTRARSRSKSILFDNDFITSQAYKSLKPLIQSSSPNAKDSSLSHSWMKEKGSRKKAKPKAINFFDRMRDSPIRRCTISGAKLPSDFLICFRTSSSSPSSLNPHNPSSRQILPSRLLHPRFEPQRIDKGRYLSCRREMIESLLVKKTWQRLDSSASISPDIVHLVENGLQQRVVQEIEILSERMRCLPLDSGKVGRSGYGYEVIFRGFESIDEIRNEEGYLGNKEGKDDDEVQAIIDISNLQSPSQTQSIESIQDGIDFLTSSNGNPIPIYNLSSCLPPSIHQDVIRNLAFLLRSQARHHSLHDSNIEPPPVPTFTPTPLPTLSPIFSISSASPFYRRSPVDPVPLLIALWRLVLWSSPHGKGWTGGIVDVERRVQEGEEVVEGFKEVQGVMHTRW